MELQLELQKITKKNKSVTWIGASARRQSTDFWHISNISQKLDRFFLVSSDSGERRRNYPQKMTLSNNCCSTTFSPQRSVLLSFLIYKSQELQKENIKTCTQIQTYTTALMTATAKKTKHIQKRSECQSQRCQLNDFSVTCGDFSTYEVSWFPKC